MLSYQIQYPVKNKAEKAYYSGNRKTSIISIIAVVCAASFLLVYCIGIDTLSEFMIPGDNAVTISAINQMQDNLKAGVPVMDAITAFCEEIISSANFQ